jgi:hypothetical protein
MIKVYQTIVDKGHGNCMQAAIASLFELPLNDVPNFIELKDGWFSTMYNFISEHNAEYHGLKFNRNYTTLWHPTEQCFKVEKWHRPSVITKKCLYKENGINGLFYASVLSPKYFNFFSGNSATHAVIIDRDFNVVHDPNPEYQNILKYPLTTLLDYNGIIDVTIINSK